MIIQVILSESAPCQTLVGAVNHVAAFQKDQWKAERRKKKHGEKDATLEENLAWKWGRTLALL